MATATPATRDEQDTLHDPGVDLAWLAERIEYRRFQECIHCGLCTASCPTYILTGDENDSPRGRIYLMRAVTDGRLAMSDDVRYHLHRCLDCRACETACPSGVRYGQLIEPFKIALHHDPTPKDRPSPLQRLILHHFFPYPKRVKIALAPARLMQKFGLMHLIERAGLTKLLPPTLQRMQAMLPELSSGPSRLPEILPPIGPKRARVALFTGCVADAMFPDTNAATARVLQHNGCEVVIPRSQVCCGAIHFHSGADGPAFDLARQNLDTFNPAEYDAIIINAAGCGAMLKEYTHNLPPELRDRAGPFVAKIKDVSEFLHALGPIPPKHPINERVTYHDACHLCHAQQIRAQPRALLELIPGVDLIPLEETEICCGAAGTYNLTQPELSQRLGDRKAHFIEATGADVVATGNVGCILQIGKMLKADGSPIRVAHPMDLLDRAYQGTDNPSPPKS